MRNETKGSTSKENESSDVMAAIDLGSNSFHLVVARVHQGELRVLSKLGEKVQLGAGLNDAHWLTEDAQNRALACLARFAQKLRQIPKRNVRAVGTNTLRAAKNSAEFCASAQELLGVPIEVIAGREEARLIYLGVAHSLSDDAERRLVIDIGGGSTEFIIGERFEARTLESLHMGCVSFSQRFFPDGKISAANFNRAVKEAEREILYIKDQLQGQGWTEVVGSSGTFKAVAAVLHRASFSAADISQEALDNLCKRMVKLGHIKQLGELGVKKDRLNTFPGGLAIVKACFETLGIREANVSDGALREGVLYDLLGRRQHENVRERTIQAMCRRFDVDPVRAESVAKTADTLFNMARAAWQFDPETHGDLLRWAAMVHEIGLAIAHAQFHKHGAYLVEHSDMAGFSYPVQKKLALLVRCHRRKLLASLFDEVDPDERPALMRLAILLRLAIHLQRGGREASVGQIELTVDDRSVQLITDDAWLQAHPLTEMELEREADYLAKVGYQFTIRTRSTKGRTRKR